MEIDILIIIIDIIGSLGFGYFYSKDIKKDLRKAGQIGSYMPVIVFLVSLLPCAAKMMQGECIESLTNQLPNVFVGYFAGVISSAIAGLIGDSLKNRIKNK